MWYQSIEIWAQFWTALSEVFMTPNYCSRMPALPCFYSETSNLEGGGMMAHYAALVSVHALHCATVITMKKKSKHLAPSPLELHFFLLAYTALALWTASARVCDLCHAGFAAVFILMSLMSTLIIMARPCFTETSTQQPSFGSPFELCSNCSGSLNDNMLPIRMPNFAAKGDDRRMTSVSDIKSGGCGIDNDTLRNRLAVLRRRDTVQLKRRKTCGSTPLPQRSYNDDEVVILSPPATRRAVLQSLMVDGEGEASRRCDLIGVSPTSREEPSSARRASTAAPTDMANNVVDSDDELEPSCLTSSTKLPAPPAMMKRKTGLKRRSILRSLTRALQTILPGLVNTATSDKRRPPNDSVIRRLSSSDPPITTRRKQSSDGRRPGIRSSMKESPEQGGSSVMDPSDHASRLSGDETAVIDIVSVNADSVVQKMLGRIAQEYGLGFHPVRSGEKALEMLDDKRISDDTEAESKLPTLILMGTELPGRDGYKTTREIRRLYPNAAIPVIMITSCDSESTIQRTFEAGANDLVVIKPLVKENLVARIGAQLRTLHFWRGQVESRQNELLLKEMLPGPIIKRLKDGERLIHDKLEEVSIIFTDIVSFTTLSSSHPTQHVIQMLDTLFTEFDKLTDKYGIYKVETIGDSYMAVAGLDSSTREGHAHDAINLAADMVAAAKKVKMLNGDPIEIRAGVHTGPAHAGVVGRKMPRYCLFGDTVNTASRMESTGFAGCVQLSSATHAAFVKEDFAASENKISSLISRGKRDIKGKGIMETWLAKTGDWEKCLELDSLHHRQAATRLPSKLMS